MKIIAIKDMSAGNSETGDAWQETKVFYETDTLLDVMKWVGIKKRVVLSIPENETDKFNGLISGAPF